MSSQELKTEASRKKRAVTRLLLLLKLAVSVGLLAVLLSWIDFDDLIENYANIYWAWLIAGLAILQTQGMISTLKWQLILRSEGTTHGYLFLWKTYLIGGFLSLFLPTSFGGDVYKVWALNQTGTKVSKSAASVLFDRITGAFALTTIGLIGASLLLEPGQVAAIGAAYLAGIIALAILTSDTVVTRLPDNKSKFLGSPFRILRSFNTYRQSPRYMAAFLALSALFQFNVVAIVFCYARSLHISPAEVSFQELLATVPVIYLTEMLPISINGIGVRDGAFVFFFSRIGGTADQGLALSLLIVAIRYIKGLIGGSLLLTTIVKNRRSKNKGDVIEPGPETAKPHR